MTMMMMMMASDHQPRQAPTQWQWGEWSGWQLGRLTQVRSSAKISSFMMMDVDMLDQAYPGEELGQDQQRVPLRQHWQWDRGEDGKWG